MKLGFWKQIQLVVPRVTSKFFMEYNESKTAPLTDPAVNIPLDGKSWPVKLMVASLAMADPF